MFYESLRTDTVAALLGTNPLNDTSSSSTVELRTDDKYNFQVGDYIAAWSTAYGLPGADSSARIGKITNVVGSQFTIEWSYLGTPTTAISGDIYIGLLPEVSDTLVALFGATEASTGWADYVDGSLTEGAPLQLVADTDTVLMIDTDTGVIRDSQKPSDVDTFFDSDTGKITGRNGDGLSITMELKAKPTNVNTTLLEVWLDIGGAVGEIYRRPFTFPKGNGVERNITFTTIGYTLDTWEQNGATIYVRANGTCDIYRPRVVLTRTHKAK